MTLFYCAHWQTYVSGEKLSLIVEIQIDNYHKHSYNTVIMFVNRYTKVW